jgi:hyperosmotically inducible protein
MRYLAAAVVLAGAISAGAQLAYGQSKDAAPASGTEVDNTRMNKADRNDTRQTPQGQSGVEADRRLTAAVRRAITRDKSLSTYAHNVKVVTHDGVVTLRGPVRTSDEKAKVSELAQQVSGVSRVDDQLLVKNRDKS